MEDHYFSWKSQKNRRPCTQLMFPHIIKYFDLFIFSKVCPFCISFDKEISREESLFYFVNGVFNVFTELNDQKK